MSLAYDLHLGITYLSRCRERLLAAGEAEAAEHADQAFRSLRIARQRLSDTSTDLCAWVDALSEADDLSGIAEEAPEILYPELSLLESLPAERLRTRATARQAIRRFLPHRLHRRADPA